MCKNIGKVRGKGVVLCRGESNLNFFLLARSKLVNFSSRRCNEKTGQKWGENFREMDWCYYTYGRKVVKI